MGVVDAIEFGNIDVLPLLQAVYVLGHETQGMGVVDPAGCSSSGDRLWQDRLVGLSGLRQ